MHKSLLHLLHGFSESNISEERKLLLQTLVDYIQSKKNRGDSIHLNFICTHNSRRSHLSQIWAQTMAYHFNLKDVACYSGGTEATAMFPKVVETLIKQGFEIMPLSKGKNPVYAVKYAVNEPPIICFSKTYDSFFNPKSNFGAIMTCDSADAHCPMVLGAEKRFSIKYNDPKVFDGTDQQTLKYQERSLEIGQEMYFVFSKIREGLGNKK